MAAFLLPSDLELFDRLHEPAPPCRGMKRALPDELQNDKTPKTECREEEAIAKALEAAGLKKGSKEMVKAIYCFWKLGPGWHSYASLSDVYNEHWPLRNDVSIVKDPESRIRNNCKRLNDEVKRTGRGSLAGHDSDCKRTETHGICQKRDTGSAGSLYTLEPYLETVVRQACNRFVIPLTPPSSPNGKLKRPRKADVKTTNYVATFEKVKEELQTFFNATLVAEKRSWLYTTEELNNRIENLNALLSEQIKKNEAMQIECDSYKDNHVVLASNLSILCSTNDQLKRTLEAVNSEREALRQEFLKREAASALTELHAAH